MKIVLIYKSDGTAGIDPVRNILEKTGIRVEDAPVNPAGGKAGFLDGPFFSPPGLSARSGENKRVYALIAAALPGHWFDFLAGFSLGSGIPFLVYGEEAAAAVPPDLAFCFPAPGTEAALNEYFEAGKEAFKQQEKASAALLAREELLRKGIPVTEESLARSVSEGCAGDVSLFFAAGYSPNSRDNKGVPLLNLSARKGDRGMLRLLIQSGADVDLYANDRGTSALVDSATGKHRGLAADLLEAGADVNTRSKDGQSALIVAVGAGDEVLTELLLKAGADPDVTDSLGVSARKYAALFHQKAMMDLFETYTPVKVEG